MDFSVMGLSKDDSFGSGNGAEIKKQKWCGSGFLKQDKIVEEDDFRECKIAKSSSSSTQRICKNGSIIEDEGQQMLSFSNPSSKTAVTWPYLQQWRNSGYGVVISGIRSPFTQSQWMELEHQALIYKYITANVPVPSSLLNPIKKALESACFSTFAGLKPNAFGWGSLQMGFSNSDPEPGRCRRTDGKKWRCSRDAVAEQKYCERHMNRGRHRSRKPVEGQQTGHSPAGITANTTKPPPNPSFTLASGIPANSGLKPETPNTNRSIRSLIYKEDDNGGELNHHHHTMNLSLSSPKQPKGFEEFGLVCSDSLLNPLIYEQDNKSHHSFREFMEEQPERTELSIAIPLETSSSSSSKQSAEYKNTQMGLGVGILHDELNRRQANWIPISWEPSLGGPLAEALHTTNSSITTKALNLMESRDDSHPSVSSPTAVLHKGSLSNSSAGSSPRAESSSKTLNGTNLWNPI